MTAFTNRLISATFFVTALVTGNIAQAQALPAGVGAWDVRHRRGNGLGL